VDDLGSERKGRFWPASLPKSSNLEAPTPSAHVGNELPLEGLRERAALLLGERPIHRA